MKGIRCSPGTNPLLTKQFVERIKEDSKRGVYEVGVSIPLFLSIEVYPYVFPPLADYTDDFAIDGRSLTGVRNKSVADIACGSGILSLIAALNGAAHVDAVDINKNAVRNCKRNARLYGFDTTITTFHGNLFSPLKGNGYDYIIANLPFVNYQARVPTPIKQALYDPGLAVHKGFLHEARRHVNRSGVILLPHANLQSAHSRKTNADFDELERLIKTSGYKVITMTESKKLGYTWRTYKISPK